jgi:hypothetical protein
MTISLSLEGFFNALLVMYFYSPPLLAFVGFLLFRVLNTPMHSLQSKG